MSTATESFSQSNAAETVSPADLAPGSWPAAWAAALPFLVFALKMSLMEAPFFPSLGIWLGATWIVATHLILAIGLGIGWGRGFPRWVYPYIGLLAAHLAYSIYYIGSPRWLLVGLLLWLPLLVVLVAVLLLVRSLRPLGHLCSGIWQDWTRISFGVYGFIAGLIFISFDEVHWPHDILYSGLAMLVMAAGALIYIRSTSGRQRTLALLGGLSLAWMVATAGLAFYWHGRQEGWMSRPGNGYETARQMARFGVKVSAVMLAPGLVGLVRRLAGGTK